MNPTILNRDFQHPADGWYQIEPKGEHLNRPYGIVQVIDDAATESIVNRFNAEAQGPNFAGMLVDHEHFKHDSDKETIAYGWLTQLQNRDDGVYGQIRWTGTGRAAVDSGDYRFFSTEYDPGEVKVLNDGKSPKRIRPMRLDGLTLTNNPNNKGGKPITNRTLQPANDKEFRQGLSGSLADNENKKHQTKKMKSVANRLGLSADASEEAVLAEVAKLFNRAETAEIELPKLKNRVIELETSNAALLGEQVDGILAEFGLKDEKVVNRLKPMLLPLKNRAEREAALSDLGHKKAEPSGKGGKLPAPYEGVRPRLLNREDGKTPGQAADATTDESARVDKIRNRASELQGTTPGRSWESCWAQAQRETASKS